MRDLPSMAGWTGAHLLITDTPQTASPTAEQTIRGGADAAADWIVLLSGYDPAILDAALGDRFAPAALHRLGAQAGATAGRYQLDYTMTTQDLTVP
jgi:hypothetical protein